MKNEKSNILIKKLIFQSNNRGFRENDIILGGFSKKHLENFTLEELYIYQEFLKENDPDIFLWLTDPDSLPKKYEQDIIMKLIKYSQ